MRQTQCVPEPRSWRVRATRLAARASLVCVLALADALLAPRLALADVTCTAGNTLINFGAYDVLGGTVLDGAGSITVTCVNTGAAITVAYTAKLAPPGNPRALAHITGVDRLNYNLYVDSARTQVWGDGTGGTFTILGTVAVPRNSTVTDAPKSFFGRIAPGGQDVSAASPVAAAIYAQLLTVTVTCTPVGPC
jgi:spore coat protein U-like protein